MVKTTLVLVLALIVAGCGTSGRKLTEYEYVDRPVLVCPTPQELNGGNPVPYQPDLEIYNLTKDSTPGEVARAYRITIKQLQSYSEVLHKLLSSYDRQSEEYKKLKQIIETLYPEGTSIPAQFGE